MVVAKEWRKVSDIDLPCVAVMGASSMVGADLLQQLRDSGYEVHAFSRSHRAKGSDGANWRICSEASLADIPKLKLCVCAAPIWVLPEFFSQLLAAGVRRVVALSSTSVFTKLDSLDVSERRLSQKIADAERSFMEWAKAHGIEWVILRPTLIYGSGADKNIAVIAKFILRFGFFPLYGKASGLRQPVHAVDVAKACVSALQLSGVKNTEFNISGAEVLTYKKMVERVFMALGRKPKWVSLPGVVFSFGIFFIRLLPRYRHWSVGMALRMNKDQIFDCSRAACDLGVSPRSFNLDINDFHTNGSSLR